jgi:hypothetical protein
MSGGSVHATQPRTLEHASGHRCLQQVDGAVVAGAQKLDHQLGCLVEGRGLHQGLRAHPSERLAVCARRRCERCERAKRRASVATTAQHGLDT